MAILKIIKIYKYEFNLTTVCLFKDIILLEIGKNF